MAKFFFVVLIFLSGLVAAANLEVNFSSGSVKLSGTLLIPESSGPRPAIVLVHGSGPSDRSGYLPVAESFAKSGFTTLIYDKRGTGKSGGSWINASIEDLAHDVSAAIAFLRRRADVNPECVGIWGVSQAGWIVPLVNEKTRFDFLILVTGGGASPLETELYGYEMEWKHAGVTEAEKNKARNLLQQYFEYLKTGQKRNELVNDLAIAKKESWYRTIPLDRILPSEENRKDWSWVADYNPAPYIEKMEMPVLLLFGGKDMQTPTELAVQKWKEGLTKAGNNDFTICIFPEAAHAMTLGEHTEATKGKFVPGYFDAMAEWLNVHARCS